MALRDEQDIKAFFNRPADKVAVDLATAWGWFNDHAKGEKPSPIDFKEGQGQILGLQTPDQGVIQTKIDQIHLYADAVTRAKWANRGAEIAGLQPGDAIAYSFRSHTLTFIRTGNGAENIMLAQLIKLNPMGQPSEKDEDVLKSNAPAKLVGFRHQSRGRITLSDYKGQKSLLLCANGPVYAESELNATIGRLINGGNGS